MRKAASRRTPVIGVLVALTAVLFAVFTLHTLWPRATAPTGSAETGAPPASTSTGTTSSTPTSPEETSAEPTVEPSESTATSTPSDATDPWPTRPTDTSGGAAEYSGLDNTLTTWNFVRPDPRDQDIPAGAPAAAVTLADRYRAIWQVPTQERVLYLTFDEGYEYGSNTWQILNVLRDKGVPAAFFITGDFLRLDDSTGRTGAELVGRMLEEGHLVCNHTLKHPLLPTILDEQGLEAMKASVLDLEAAFAERFGFGLAPYLRPPGGAYSERTLSILSDMGYRAVFWSFAYADWKTDAQPDPAAALAQITGEFHPGSVILLHAVSETNVAVLPDVIDRAREAGYRFARLDTIP